MKTSSVLLLPLTILTILPSTLLADLLCTAGRGATLVTKMRYSWQKSSTCDKKKQYGWQKSNTRNKKAIQLTKQFQARAMAAHGTVASLGKATAHAPATLPPQPSAPSLVLVILVKFWCHQPAAIQERKAACVNHQRRPLWPVNTSHKSWNRWTNSVNKLYSENSSVQLFYQFIRSWNSDLAFVV